MDDRRPPRKHARYSQAEEHNLTAWDVVVLNLPTVAQLAVSNADLASLLATETSLARRLAWAARKHVFGVLGKRAATSWPRTHVPNIRALAALPGKDDAFVSCGGFGTVHVWRPKKDSIGREGFHPQMVQRARVTLGDRGLPFMKHTDAIAMCADAMAMAVATNDSIEVWDMPSPHADCHTHGKLRQTLKGHANHVYTLAVLRDGRLASGSEDATVRLWDLVSGGMCTDVLKGHTGTVWAVCALPDGSLASGSRDATIHVWKADGSCAAVLRGHRDAVSALAVIPSAHAHAATKEGNRKRFTLVSGSFDATIRLWKDGQVCVKCIQGHGQTAWILSLCAMPNGGLASGDSQGRVVLWTKDAMRVEDDEGGGRAAAVHVASASVVHVEVVEGSTLKKGACCRMLNALRHTHPVNDLVVLSSGTLVSGSAATAHSVKAVW